MEKMLVCGVVYITVLILLTVYNYVSFKNKERKDSLMYDYMLLSCVSAMMFIIVWFML